LEEIVSVSGHWVECLLFPGGKTGLFSISAAKLCAISSNCLAAPSTEGVANHAAGRVSVRHISTMSHTPTGLRVLNNIKLFILIGTIDLAG
jgi:hypothetical protein